MDHPDHESIRPWKVLFDDDFATWLTRLNSTEQRELLAHAKLLQERGPQLGRPYVDTIKGSRFKNMKELRVQISGRPWRFLFAFDPNRDAILLDGGDKGGNDR